MFEIGGSDVPVIFPNVLSHADVARISYASVISAGFIQVCGDDKPMDGACVRENAAKVCCFGDSETLKKKSRPEDSEIIDRELNRWMR